MSERSWTENQRDAIDARQGTLFVSAAAGSGKTAVLVQRVIERLTDPVSPSDADRLLVVTFTNAAAAEMKERIGERLAELLEKNPSDRQLQRQQMLLQRANISTIHSFCSDLVRENFYKLNISPDFRILEEHEWKLLREQAMAQVLEQAYAQASPDFQAFLEGFCAERNDQRLMGLIDRLYDFLRTHPFPKRWMEEQEQAYRADMPIGQTPWGQVILDYAVGMASYAIGLTEHALDLLIQDDKLKKAYTEMFSGELAGYQHLQEALKSGDWDRTAQALSSITYIRMPTPRGYKDDPLQQQISSFRKTAKEAMEKLRNFFALPEAECRSELRRLAPLIHTLFDLTLRFSDALDALKSQRKAADFNDLEHWALRLLMEETEEGIRRTEDAIQLSKQFDEVMVDECQDINETQDLLFRAISKEERNLFMVGDVKQSIYGFRQAMPKLFLERRNAFPAYSRKKNQYPASLMLDRNFRSRKTVVDSVNFLFRQLMSEQAGDVAYQGQEELVAGAEYFPQEGCETRLDLLRPDQEIEEEASEEAMAVLEARHISTVIASMMEEGFQVTDRTGQRPARYGDFCILLRSANRYAAEYAKELQRHGIPAQSDVSPGFFETSEIAVMLSFLRVIDNPIQDIPLLAVLMSPVYGFTADDMADIRLEGRTLPLYLALVQYAEAGDPRARLVLKDLDEYRMVAATVPSDRMLERIYEKSGYRNMVQAMDDGKRRLANLQLLLDYARKYESFGYHGISRFIQFLDRLQEKNFDLPSAAVCTESDNVVQVMSIHRSKGLEFPVCIIAGCDREINSRKADTLFHPRLGVGMKLWNNEGFYRYNTLPRKAIALEEDRETVSEELRILYVAATRAREKLIFVATVKNLEKRLAVLGAPLTETERIDPHLVTQVSRMSDWLMMCGMRHPDGQKLRELAGVTDEMVQRKGYTPWDIRILLPPAVEEVQEVRKEEPAQADLSLLQTLRRQVEYRYPYEKLRGVPAKVTASALTKQEESAHPGESLLPRPSFLYSKGLTPAERGIAFHSFLQFANYAAAAENPQAELDRLQAQGFLTKEQADAVNRKQVGQFFQSPIARRMLASSYLVREYRFTVEIPAVQVTPDSEEDPFLANQPVILQGAVDCMFEEAGELVIVDYKSDRSAHPEELWQRYHKQLELYAMAMEQCTGKPVKEYLLYSFHWNQEIRKPQ
ncbi:MAG: helicase-exonuclease AddAB subunit AddA [Clostridiales bacterium]|jgi:ATP-dependent helicase/nuclease subunit A|nr:helicase-exonuclease AddAB subunit AddA [Clostridiales bacterium]